MFLPEKAQFDYWVSLPESADIGEAIDNAMKLIEDENLSISMDKVVIMAVAEESDV